MIMRISKAAFLTVCLIAGVLRCPGGQQQSPKKKDAEPSPDVVVERLETTYRYQDDGTGEVVEYKRFRIVTEAGRAAVGQAYFVYSSRLQELRIDFLRTLKHDGSRVEADPSQALDVASPVTQAAPTFSDVKIKALPAPKLDVGDALEFQATTFIRTPLKPGDFWVIEYPDRADFVEAEVVVLEVPAGRALKLKADPKSPYKTEETAGRRIYRWELRNPKPRADDDEPVKPLFAASTLSDWRQVGDWYLGLQVGRTEPTPEIGALVAKLTEGKKTPREKLDAIYAYVSESIRYVAIELGIGGWQAHPVADVLRNGYGDCKDKHALLAAMLEAAGIKTYPVLVHYERGVIEPEVPVPAQFDHVMSLVTIDGESLWLDTTIEVAPAGFLRKDIRGRKALVMKPGSAELTELPAQSPVPERIHLAVTGKLDATGNLTLDNDLTLRGSAEVLYRAIFRAGNKEMISNVIKATTGLQLEGATPGEPKTSDVSDLSRPFEVSYRVTHDNFFGPLESTKDMEVPHALLQKGAWQQALSKAQEAREKKAKGEELSEDQKEIKLNGVAEIEEVVDIELAPSYQVDLPLPIHAERSFVTYDSGSSFDRGHLKLTRIAKLKIDKLPAEGWQELESFQKLVDRDLGQSVHIRRTGLTDFRALSDHMSVDQLNEAAAKELQENMYGTARRLLERATTKDPKHASAWRNLGRAYTGLGLYDQAERAYKKQLEINPSDDYAYKGLSYVYRSRRQYDEALSAFKKQLEIDPFDSYVYLGMADTYTQIKKWDDAAQALEKAKTILHDTPYLFARTGALYLKAGKTEEARRNFDRALESDPTPNSLNEVAYAMAESRFDLPKAEEYARSAVEKAAAALQVMTSLKPPAHYAAAAATLGAYLDTLGWVLYQRGEVPQAEVCLKSAFELRQNAVVAEHLAQAYAALNNPSEVLRFYAYASQRVADSASLGDAGLEQYIRRQFGDPKSLKDRLAKLNETFASDQQVKLAGRPFAWPSSSRVKDLVSITVHLVADEKGAVGEADATGGEEPFRSTALGDARLLTFRSIAWPDHSLKVSRTVKFYYLFNKSVVASWSFGEDVQEPELPPREAEAQAAADQGTQKTEPGDEPSQESVRLEPDNGDRHFTLGAQLEAKATTEFQNNGQLSQQDFRDALEQYRIACQLEPQNRNYKSAYQRLSRKLKRP